MEINAAEFKAKCLKLLDEVATTHEPLSAETGDEDELYGPLRPAESAQ